MDSVLSFTNGARLKKGAGSNDAIEVKTATTTLSFTGSGGGIDGNINNSASATLNISFDATHKGDIVGNITNSNNGTTTITNASTITGQILAQYNGTNKIIMDDSSKITQLKVSGGENHLVVKTNSQFNHDIIGNANGGYSGQNTLALNGTNVSLGASGKSITISTGVEGAANAATASNLILLNGSTSNSAYITSLTSSGNYSGGVGLARTYNILSFEQDSGNTLEIGGLSASYGNNIIGKGYLAKDTNGYATLKKIMNSAGDAVDTSKSAFDQNDSVIVGNIMNADNAATFATLSITGGISADYGRNFINVTNNLNITNDITASSNGENYINGAVFKTTGSISASGGSNTINVGANTFNTTGAISASGGGSNTIVSGTFVTTGKVSATGSATNRITSSGTVTIHSLEASYSGYNYIKATGLTLTQDSISANAGGNKIAIEAGSGNINIDKTISVTTNGGHSGQNTLALTGANVSLGASGKSITISTGVAGSTNLASASNLILLNGSTSNSAYITSLTSSGNYSGGVGLAKTYNILSFDGSSADDNTLVIGGLSASYGNNIIGKGYLEADSDGYATLKKTMNSAGDAVDTSKSAFDQNDSVIANNIMNANNAATFATLNITGGISADYGRNFINVTNALDITNDITASNSGENYINSGTFVTTGKVSATGSATNRITSSGTVTICSLEASYGGYNYIKATGLTLTQDSISANAGGNKIAINAAGDDINIGQSISVTTNSGYSGQNTLALTGANVSLGASGKSITISTGVAGGANAATASNLILLNGSTGNSAYITSLTSSGNYSGGIGLAKTYNILSFNKTSSGGNNLVIGDLSASYGNNIIGKGYLEADSDGYATLKKTMSGSDVDTSTSAFDQDGNVIVGNIMNAANAATFDTLNITGGIFADYGRNFINVTNDLNIANDITASSNGENYINGGNFETTGAISASGGGSNTINVGANTFNTTGAISASGGGSNTIVSGAFEATGKVSATGSATNRITSSGAVTIHSLEASYSGYNYIKATGLTLTQDSISANAGGNKIAIEAGSDNINIDKTISVTTNGGHSGQNTLALTGANVSLGASGKSITISTGVAGSTNLASASNLILLNGSTSNSAYITSLSSSGNYTNGIGPAKTYNILSFEQDSGNTLKIGSISASFANNIIGKGFLQKDTDGYATLKTGADSDPFTDGNLTASIDSLMSNTYAATGVLSISGGMVADSNSRNIIAFKASNSSTSTMIAANSETGNAISGNAIVYLDVSTSGLTNGIEAIQNYLTSLSSNPSNKEELYTTLAGKAVIAGDITGSSATNIKIVGTQKTADNAEKTQMGILGNINTGGGTANIVLVDSFFAPSEMIVTTPALPYTGASTNALGTPITIGGEQAGNITTASGATTNMVTRFTDKSPAPTGCSLYTINNQGSGKTNIVLQGNYQLGANVNYGGSYNGQVNMIFASESNIGTPNGTNGEVATDTFATKMDDPTQADTQMINSTDASVNRIMGVTYKNGLKLTLQDKSIRVGDNNVSFVGTYGHYFTKINNGKISTFTLDRTATTDTINIRGLVLGTITPLDGSSAKAFNVSIAEDSAYVGSVALTSGSSVALTMQQGSKLLTDSDIFYVKELKLADNNQFEIDGLTLNTFAQNNTIVDLATMGNDLGNVETRQAFRIFAVGAHNGSAAADTGLQGQNALFRVYVNDQAQQITEVNSNDKVTSQGATLGGINAYVNKQTTRSSRAATYTSGLGKYGYVYADRIIIGDTGTLTSGSTAQTHYIQVVADSNTNLDSIHYNASPDQSGKSGTAVQGNIAVATVKNDTTNITQTQENQTQAVVVFKAQDVIQGFDQVSTTLIAQTTDEYGIVDTGSTGWTTYFVDSMKTKGATQERGELAATTLATNYDLYMANFNSLNKRMGELRDNDNSQGVWARVFNGAQTNDMGLGTKTSYTTFQGGYDYALGMEGANNYIGLAVSYSMSSSEVQGSLTQALDNNILGFNNVKSSAVEVAVYNSYVQDEGWYNDSIFKFSYIMSDFNIFGQNTTYNTNNMAFTLSDEFGYRFKLGEAKEWYIDPQLEMAFGYFDQSELKQTLGNSWLNTVADSVMTLRSRFGSSFGYDFKQFTQGKGVDAKLYVGAFYEYDYVTGGDVSLSTNLGGETTSSSAITADGRVVMNVGTNVTVKENTRIYFDFETSFAGKIRTDYQVNAGVRYSFGENTSYVPANGSKKEVAPLKVSDDNAKNAEEKQTQESAKQSQEGSNSETKSGEQKTETSADSAENKSEAKSEEKAQ